MFFINTDISNPENCPCDTMAQGSGKIVDLVVCGRECIEEKSALFALHEGAHSESVCLSRVMLCILERFLRVTLLKQCH